MTSVIYIGADSAKQIRPRIKGMEQSFLTSTIRKIPVTLSSWRYAMSVNDYPGVDRKDLQCSE